MQCNTMQCNAMQYIVSMRLVLLRFTEKELIQFFFFHVFLIVYFRYVGFAIERHNLGENTIEDKLQACICLTQSILLGSFAIMLGAHRAEIIDRNASLQGSNKSTGGSSSKNTQQQSNYDPPAVK